MAKQTIYLGTEIKLNINIEPISNITMDSYDFVVELICGSMKKNTVAITKEEAIKVDQSNYIVCADTTLLGVGRLKCRIVAHIPDGDFKDDRTRTEVVEIDTGIEIVKTI